MWLNCPCATLKFTSLLFLFVSMRVICCLNDMFVRVVAWQHVIGALLWLENDAMTHDRWERLLTVMGRVYRQSDIEGVVLIKPGPCFELVWRAVIKITCIRSLHFQPTYHTGWICLHLHTLAHFYVCSPSLNSVIIQSEWELQDLMRLTDKEWLRQVIFMFFLSFSWTLAFKWLQSNG